MATSTSRIHAFHAASACTGIGSTASFFSKSESDVPARQGAPAKNQPLYSRFVEDPFPIDSLSRHCSVSRKQIPPFYQDKIAKRFLIEQIVKPLLSDVMPTSPFYLTLVHGPRAAGLSDLVQAAVHLADQRRAMDKPERAPIVVFSVGPFVRFSDPKALHEFMCNLLDQVAKQPSVILFVDIERGLKSYDARFFLEALQGHLLRRSFSHSILLVGTCEMPWSLRNEDLKLFGSAVRVGLPSASERFDYFVEILFRCTGEDWSRRIAMRSFSAQTQFFALNNLKEVVFKAAIAGAERRGDDRLIKRLSGFSWLIGEPGFYEFPVVLSDLESALDAYTPEMTAQVEIKISSFEARFNESRQQSR